MLGKETKGSNRPVCIEFMVQGQNSKTRFQCLEYPKKKASSTTIVTRNTGRCLTLENFRLWCTMPTMGCFPEFRVG